MSQPEQSAGSATESKPHRRIRSFVIRNGRVTKCQTQSLIDYWSVYGVDSGTGLIDMQRLFPEPGPITMEIGFGNGQSLTEMAKRAPERNFIGIEVHEPGVGQLLHLINTHQLKNLRVFQADAIEVLQQQIPIGSLNRVQLFFPDPWHKKRHHKRRIVNDLFLTLIADRLAPGGVFHMATDWQPYAEAALQTLSSHERFTNTVSLTSENGGYAPRPSWRPLTKFEQRGQRLGHGVWDLMFKARK